MHDETEYAKLVRKEILEKKYSIIGRTKAIRSLDEKINQNILDNDNYLSVALPKSKKNRLEYDKSQWLEEFLADLNNFHSLNKVFKKIKTFFVQSSEGQTILNDYLDKKENICEILIFLFKLFELTIHYNIKDDFLDLINLFRIDISTKRKEEIEKFVAVLDEFYLKYNFVTVSLEKPAKDDLLQELNGIIIFLIELKILAEIDLTTDDMFVFNSAINQLYDFVDYLPELNNYVHKNTSTDNIESAKFVNDSKNLNGKNFIKFSEAEVGHYSEMNPDFETQFSFNSDYFLQIYLCHIIYSLYIKRSRKSIFEPIKKVLKLIMMHQKKKFRESHQNALTTMFNNIQKNNLNYNPNIHKNVNVFTEKNTKEMSFMQFCYTNDSVKWASKHF